MTKAPLGGEKTGKNPTDRAKSGVKRSVLTEGHGIPIGLTVGGANCHDKRLVESTLRSIVVRRPKASKTKRQNMLMDKGYDYLDTRQLVSDWGYTAHIKARGEEVEQKRTSTWLPGQALGGGANAFMDEQVPQASGSLGKEGCELSGDAPFRLRFDNVPSYLTFWIGS